MTWRLWDVRGVWLFCGLAMVAAGASCGSKRLPGLSSGSGATATTTTAGSAGTTSGGVGGNGGGTSGVGASMNQGGGGGVGGMAPTGPIGKLGEPCAPAGLLGCAGHAQASKLVCGPMLTWTSNGMCAANMLCDTDPGEKQGTCQPIVPACVGKQPGDFVCDGLTRIQCGPDLVTSVQIELCPLTCVAGLCAQCWPGDTQCTGNTPETCDQSGAWQSDPACVGQTCINGSCVGVCAPAEKQCVGNTPQSCGANGAWENKPACSLETPICTLGSCVGTSCLGLPETCGPLANESCCAGSIVPGGTYDRSNRVGFPATVSDFWLDRFEVTVGRFRKFVEAYPGNKPTAGKGAHPLIAGSGWDPAWDANLPVDQAALMATVKCEVQYQVWTDAPGANENLPMNCLSWFDAFAFCAWDGQRTPTEAEWNYAAAAGAEQREYPWGNTQPDPARAVYDCTGDGSAAAICGFTDILKVGQKPLGDGKWGHADLAGGLREWTLDWHHEPYLNPCVDCANLVDPAATFRPTRGGAYPHTAPAMLTENRITVTPASRLNVVGIRCAKTP